MTTWRNEAGGTRAGKPSGIFFPIGNISRVNLGIFSRSGRFSRTILRNTPTAGVSRGEGAGGMVGRGAALAEWAEALDGLGVAADDVEGSIDHTLLSAEIRYRQELLAREGRLLDEVAPLLPFAGEIIELLEIRHAGADVDGEEMAAALAGLAVAVGEADAALRSRAAAGGAGLGGGGQPTPTPIAGLRAVRVLQSYRNSLGNWYRHYAGYDPLFTWWASQPFEAADGALGRYLSTLRVRVVGWPEGGEEPNRHDAGPRGH